MATEPQLLHVGRIGRAHGLNGEVVVTLTTNRLERLEPGAVVHAADQVLVVETSRPHDRKHLVRFVGITGRSAAEAIAHRDLSAEPLDDPDELWVHELVGMAVVDQHGERRGTVEAIETNPASDLLVLDSGALVPVTFVVAIEEEGIAVDTPIGLFDLA